MLKAEMAPRFAMALLLIPTPTVADVTSELARCELEAERRPRIFTRPSHHGDRAFYFCTCVMERRGLLMRSPSSGGSSGAGAGGPPSIPNASCGDGFPIVAWGWLQLEVGRHLCGA